MNPRYIFIIFFFVFCGKPKNYDFIPTALKLSLPISIKVNSPEDIAFSSSDNYENNLFGILTIGKLSNFLQNWDKVRTVPGKLVVFQVQSSSIQLNRFLVTDVNKEVYTYLLKTTTSDSIFQQSRNNGLSVTESMVSEGKIIDSFLNTYGINPVRDLVVFASDTSTAKNLQYVLRLYYTLRYWGLDKNNIAILNGSIGQFVNSGEVFTTNNQNFQVKQDYISLRNLYVDNTSLHATLGDVLHILLNGRTNFEKVYPIPSQGVSFLDTRSINEYSPPNTSGQTEAPFGKTCQVGSNCKSPIDGNLKGSINLEWSELLENPNSGDYRFKSKSSIETIFLSKGLAGKKHIISYSRIGFRASTPLFASIAILGYPARLYDGSWIEFSSFASDFSGTNLITNSPWRTDRTSLVDSLTYVSPSNVIPTFSYPTTSQFSTNSNKIIDEDKNYIRGTIPSTNTGGGASGGGGNACGG